MSRERSPGELRRILARILLMSSCNQASSTWLRAWRSSRWRCRESAHTRRLCLVFLVAIQWRIRVIKDGSGSGGDTGRSLRRLVILLAAAPDRTNCCAFPHCGTGTSLSFRKQRDPPKRSEVQSATPGGTFSPGKWTTADQHPWVACAVDSV